MSQEFYELQTNHPTRFTKEQEEEENEEEMVEKKENLNHYTSFPFRTPLTLPDPLHGAQNTTYVMGYTQDINDFIMGWYQRTEIYKESYAKDALFYEKINTVLVIKILITALLACSGNIYILSQAWYTSTTFQKVVALVSIWLSVVTTVARFLDFQDRVKSGFHACTALSEISNDIMLNQSLHPNKRMYAGVFIQNVVKRTETVLNYSHHIKVKIVTHVGQHHYHDIKKKSLDGTRKAQTTSRHLRI
jgi:hypothetical protein